MGTYQLQSKILKEGYIGDYHRVIKGDTRSLHYTSYGYHFGGPHTEIIAFFSATTISPTPEKSCKSSKDTKAGVARALTLNIRSPGLPQNAAVIGLQLQDPTFVEISVRCSSS